MERRAALSLLHDPCASQALLLIELSSCSDAVESTESFREIWSGRLPSSLGLSTHDSVDLPVFQRQVVKTLDSECKRFSALVS